MTEPAKISSREELEDWLRWVAEDRGHEEGRRIAVWIAHRAAMRVLPVFINWMLEDEAARKQGVTPLPVLRASLVFGAFGAFPTQALGPNAASAAEAATYAIAGVASASPESYVRAFVGAAANTYDAAAAADAEVATTHAAAAAAAVETLAAYLGTDDGKWSDVEADVHNVEAGGELAQEPIRQAPALEDAWSAARDRLSGAPLKGKWAFWVRWYEAALEGTLYREENRTLLTRIALIGRNPETGELIGEEEWNKGPGHVARLIAELCIEHAIAVSPNAERLFFDEADGLFRVEPVVALATDARGYAIAKLRAALALIDGAKGGNDPYGGLAAERDLLRDWIDDPEALPKSLFDLSRKIPRRVRSRASNGECPEPEKDANLKDFLFELEETATDLLADEEVKKLNEHRSRILMEKATPQDAADLPAAVEILKPALEPKLGEEMTEDAEVAVDEAADPEDRRAALHRFGSRLVRIYQSASRIGGIVDGGLENVARVFKNVGIIVGSGGAVWVAIQFFFRLFGI